MSEMTSLPTLFGRFTAILSEHERFGVTLRRISAMCAALELAPDLQPGPLIADLFAELSQHFVVEEAEAYFGTLVQERPTLLHRVAELKAEHGAMLQTITELCAITADDPERSGLPIPTRRLITQLEAHEETESELLREFFS